MDRSIFNLIKQAIITHSPKDVMIHERPLSTELIETEKKDKLFSPYDFLPKNYKGKKLILTRYLIDIGRVFILFIIAVIYAIYDLLHRIVTGEWKSEKLTSEEHARRVKEMNEKEKENESNWIKRLHLHPERWRGIQSSTGLNTLILVFVLTMSVLMLVWGFHFLIKEVVLPENNSRINSYGVVSIDQGCLEEQHFFLLNSATFWTNTGIAVNEGDKVYITASGSMYSDIDDMCNAAKENRKLRYPRSNFLGNYEKMGTDAEYCVYGRFHKDSMPAYGSLLYQICDEIRGPRPYNTDTNPEVVRQINFAKYREGNDIEKRYWFEADKSGLLYFTFNDILLDDQMIETIINDCSNTSSMCRHLKELCRPQKKKCRSEGGKKNVDTVGLDTVSWLKENVDSLIWFEDNFGEALINIRVVKNVSYSRLDCIQKTLVLLYRFQRWLYTDTEKGRWYDFSHSGLLILLLLILGWFVLDVSVSNMLNREKKSDENKKDNNNN